MKFKSKYIIILIFCCIVISMFLFLRLFGDRNKDNKNELKNTAKAFTIQMSDNTKQNSIQNEKQNKTKKQPLKNLSVSDSNKDNIENPLIQDYMDMMYESSQFGDDRSPKLSETPSARIWTPSPEILSNPDLYAEEQKNAHDKNFANVYEAFGKRIQSIEENIRNEESQNTKTKQELNEAKDALNYMKKFIKELEEQLKKE